MTKTKKLRAGIYARAHGVSQKFRVQTKTGVTHVIHAVVLKPFCQITRYRIAATAKSGPAFFDLALVFLAGAFLVFVF